MMDEADVAAVYEAVNSVISNPSSINACTCETLQHLKLAYPRIIYVMSTRINGPGHFMGFTGSQVDFN